MRAGTAEAPVLTVTLASKLRAALLDAIRRDAIVGGYARDGCLSSE